MRAKTLSGAFEGLWEQWGEGEAQTRFALATALNVKGAPLANRPRG